MTPSYFHDRSIATLPDATKAMVRAQLGAALGRNRNERHPATYRRARRGAIPAAGHTRALATAVAVLARIDSSFETSDSYLLNCFID
jgi:cytochrome c peroxidase